MNYRYTEEEITEAHNTNLVRFLESQGEEIKQTGSRSYWFHNGEPISIKDNVWFNFYTQEGGEAIAFVKEYFGVGFKDAVSLLIGKSASEIPKKEYVPKPKKPFVLPERNENSNRAFAYLVNTRGIDKEVVSTFMRCNLIYEDKHHHNVVFAGYSKNGEPKHAHMRGSGSETSFKMTTAGSDPSYSFHWKGNDNEMYLFEAPVDMLSYITLFPGDWKNHTYAAACSVSDKVLFQCLTDNPNIDTVHICFDNDEPGQKAAERILEKLSETGITVDILKPDLKDWNEDLLTTENPVSTLSMK